MKSNDHPKLPAKQLAILAVARFAEPLAMTSVFPYLPEMIASFGIEKDAIAQWAGLTSAVFSLAQSITAVWWGRASDTFGRKPVIIVGLLCTMTCFLVWGMSTSLTMAITVRAIQGASNGNVGIIRTMVAEMVPERELQPKAFSIMPLVWSVGSIFGPAFGGFFANPAKQFPGLFGNSKFLNKFPFALPNIMGSVIFMISVTTAVLFLRETLASKRDSRDWGLVLGERLTGLFQRGGSARPRRRYSFEDAETTTPLLRKSRSMSKTQAHRGTVIKKVKTHSMRSVFTQQTVLNLVCYTFLALHSVAYDQVLPVFLHYPAVEHTPDNVSLPFVFSGGFGLDSGSIGTIFTIYGTLCGLIQFFLYPPVASHFGILNCFKASVAIIPITYFLTPFTVLIEDQTTKYAALMTIMTIKAFGVIFGFPSTTILLTNSASSLSILGTLNGVATTFSALGRAFGPVATGAVFTLGAKHGIMILPWWLLGTIAAIGAVPAWWIIEGEGPTASKQDEALDDADEEDEYDDDDSQYENMGGPSSSSSASRTLAAARTQPTEIVAQPEGQDDQPLFSTSVRSTRSGYGTLAPVRH